MLFGDDGSETRLSITVLSPQAPSQYHIHYQVMGDTTGKKGIFFPDYIKNVWKDVRVWQNYKSFHPKSRQTQECLVNNKIAGTDDWLELTLNYTYDGNN